MPRPSGARSGRGTTVLFMRSVYQLLSRTPETWASGFRAPDDRQRRRTRTRCRRAETADLEARRAAVTRGAGLSNCRSSSGKSATTRDLAGYHRGESTRSRPVVRLASMPTSSRAFCLELANLLTSPATTALVLACVSHEREALACAVVKCIAAVMSRLGRWC